MNIIGAYKGFVDRIEKGLEPVQWLVSVILVIIIGVSVWALLSKDKVRRTGWTIFMLLP